MKIVSIASAAITILLVLSTLICGLWLKSKGADVEGIAFHMKIGAASVIFSVMTAILLLIAVARQ